MEPIDLGTPRIDPTAFVAPGARIFGDVTVGPHAVVLFGTVIRAEFDRIEIGAYTNLQDNCVLHADAGIPCLIGANVTVAHAAVVHGARIGEHCLVGIGARVLNEAELGEGAWLAAGSVLPEGKTIPPWTLAVGTPARPLRELTEAEVARQQRGIGEYQRIAAALRAELGPDS